MSANQTSPQAIAAAREIYPKISEASVHISLFAENDTESDAAKEQVLRHVSSIIDRHFQTMLKDSAWQPIETAPKNETRILLWFVPNEVDMPSRSLAAIGKWVTRNWRDGNGKIVGDPFSFWEADCSVGAMSFEPTHWMPLPPPPTPTTK